MTHIEDYAKERTEARLRIEVQGMSWQQREKYLSAVAYTIDEMLKERPKIENSYYDHLGRDNDIQGEGE